MKQEFYNLKINTNGQRLYEFTDQTINWIEKNNFKNGILNLSIQHTSASIIVQENADPDVQTDLINYFDKLVPMDNKLYIHTTEGKDDMPAHIKSALTNNQISLSVKNNEIILGTWQGIYLFEHRLNPQTRTIIHHFFRNKIKYNFLIALESFKSSSTSFFMNYNWFWIIFSNNSFISFLIFSFHFPRFMNKFFWNFI